MLTERIIERTDKIRKKVPNQNIHLLVGHTIETTSYPWLVSFKLLCFEQRSLTSAVCYGVMLEIAIRVSDVTGPCRER